MNSKVYKWCAVPQCSNTSIKTPNKVFVYVSNKKIIRNTWLNLALRDPASVSINSPLYFCEDHFDLPNDMENYMQYHVMGSVSQVRMKPGCVPTRFDCQPDRRKHTTHNTKRYYTLKKQRKIPIEDREKKVAPKSTLAKHSELSTLAKSSGSSAQHDTANTSTVTIKNKAGSTKENDTKCTATVTKIPSSGETYITEEPDNDSNVRDPLEVHAVCDPDIKNEAFSSEEEKNDGQVEIKSEYDDDHTTIDDANEEVATRGVGACQCCLSTGEHAAVDLHSLLDCFNVAVDISGPALVCDNCEQFLQQARQFRDMVANSQSQLKLGLTQVKEEGMSLPDPGEVQATLGVEQSGHIGVQQSGHTGVQQSGHTGVQQRGLYEVQIEQFKDHQIAFPGSQIIGLAIQQMEVPTAQNEELMAPPTKLRGVPEKILRVQQGDSTVQQKGSKVLQSAQNPGVRDDGKRAEQSGHVQEELSLQQIAQPMVQINELTVDKNAFVVDKIVTRIPIVQGAGLTVQSSERTKKQKSGQKVQKKKPREHKVQENVPSEQVQKKRLKIPIIPLSRPPWLQEGEMGSQEELVMRRTKPKILRRGPKIKRTAHRSGSTETTVQQTESVETPPQETSNMDPRLLDAPCASPPLGPQQQDKLPGSSVNRKSTIYVNEDGIVKLEYYSDNENMEDDMKPLDELSPTQQDTDQQI